MYCLGREFPFLAFAGEVEADDGPVDGGLNVSVDAVLGAGFDFHDAEGRSVADDKVLLQGFAIPFACGFVEQTISASMLGVETCRQRFEVPTPQRPEESLDGGFRSGKAGIGPGVAHHETLFGGGRWARRRIGDAGQSGEQALLFASQNLDAVCLRAKLTNFVSKLRQLSRALPQVVDLIGVHG